MNHDILSIVSKILAKKRDFLAEVFRDIAQVFFASFAIESLLNDKIRWGTVFIGFILSFIYIFWVAGLILIRN